MKRARWLDLLLLVVVGVGLGVSGVRGQGPALPAPWSEMWATHPLNTSSFLISLPMVASADTYIWDSQPGNNFGNLGYGEIGVGKRGLLKFNLAEVPTQGSLPIQDIHLAIALVDTVPDSFWLGVAGTCTPWQENTATWDNANCNPPFALTSVPEMTPHWEFISLWHPGAGGIAENGYILFDTSNGRVPRRFLTREAGDEWAPRLIVSYSRDTRPPSLTGYGGAPSGTTLMTPDSAFQLSLTEDAGLRRIYFERQMKSAGFREEAVIEAAEISQQLRLEPAVDCARSNYDRTLFTAFPFPDRPLGKGFRYQVRLEDCLGKQSEPLVYEHLIHVERIESAYLRDFNDQPLEVGAVMRKEDRGVTDLLAASIQYGYGQTGYFGSISEVAEYWVDAPGFPTGSDGVIEGERNSGMRSIVRLFVPWYGFETIHAAGLELKKGEVARIPLRVPFGEQVVVATTANTSGETAEEETPGGIATLGVEDSGGAISQIAQLYVYNNHIFVAGNLVQRAGEVVTLTVNFAPTNGRDWAMRLNEIVLSAQNPDLAVEGQALVLPMETLRAGVPLPITYRVGLVRAAQPTTLTLEAPLAVRLVDFSVQPSAQFTQTDRLRYEWVMPKLLAGSRVLTATVTINTPGSYALDLSIANQRDPFLANNQGQIQLIASDNIVHLPSISAP